MRHALKVFVSVGYAALWLLFLSPAPAIAQASPPAADRAAKHGEYFAPEIKDLSDALSRAKKAAQSSFRLDKNLETLRALAEDVAIRAAKLKQRIAPRLKAIAAQLGKLGEAPKSGAPAETAAVAAERTRLSGLKADVDGAKRRVNLMQEQARQLIVKIQDARRALFTEKLLQRTRSPLRPDVWHDAMVQSASNFSVLAYGARNWWQNISARSGAVLILLIVVIGAWFALRRLVV